MPSGASSSRSESANASSANFEIAYGPRKGNALVPRDRADQDDAAAGRPHGGQKRLRDRELADDVDLELAAELVERQVLERRRDGDAGVVDEAVEPLADHAGRAGDERPVGDVEQHLGGAGRRVPALPNAREHAPAGASEPLARRRRRSPTRRR